MKKTQKSKMGWLWENMKGYRVLYVTAILGTVVYNVMQLTVPFVTQNLIDLFLTGDEAAANLVNRRTLFYQLIAAMVLLTLLRTLIVYLTCMGMCPKRLSIVSGPIFLTR